MMFRLLGPLDVREGDRVLPLGGPKQRALLAMLLLHANEAVSTDRLMEALWPEQPPGTAANTLQAHVSKLRKLLEPPGRARNVLVTRPPGYLLRVEPGELDLERFEHLVAEAAHELAAGRPEPASGALREGFALWSGPPLADFELERFAQPAIERLRELRVAALELRADAELALGREDTLVGELYALTAEFPLRERLRGQLMVALYRCGRQAEALEVYQDTRRVLVGELGIEPGHPLQELEKAILRHDPALGPSDPAASPTRIVAPADAGRGATTSSPDRRGGPAAFFPEPAGGRAILVAAEDEGALDALLPLAEALARSQPVHEIIVARLLVQGDTGGPTSEALASAAAALHERRAELLSRHVAARAAAFTTAFPGEDILRLASEQEVDLLLLDGRRLLVTADLKRGRFDLVLAEAPCDIGLVLARPERAGVDDERAVLVPFGGSEHDWAALELAAWLARAQDVPLRLLGPAADPDEGRRDASRLLATASLVVQRFAGVAAEPLLIASGGDGILAAAREAGLLVVGLAEATNERGLGRLRMRIAREAEAPTVFVRRGLRPGGLAPRENTTRYTWSLAGEAP